MIASLRGSVRRCTRALVVALGGTASAFSFPRPYRSFRVGLIDLPISMWENEITLWL